MGAHPETQQDPHATCTERPHQQGYWPGHVLGGKTPVKGAEHGTGGGQVLGQTGSVDRVNLTLEPVRIMVFASRYRRVDLTSSKMNGVVAIVLLVCFIVLVRCWTRWGGTGNQRQMPGPPGTFLLGHIMQLLRPGFHRVLTAWSKQYGGVYRISILGLPGVVVSEPQAVAHVLGKNALLKDVPKHHIELQTA